MVTILDVDNDNDWDPQKYGASAPDPVTKYGRIWQRNPKLPRVCVPYHVAVDYIRSEWHSRSCVLPVY